ncbi:LysR family transcriptional regulator [Alteromonas sp. NFXS44]|uniref:LysR family transcriptional regulator n=1 Tax=Alteromonas sp. NFXS44 TaxID=2818435 RepID=UPI0032DF6027
MNNKLEMLRIFSVAAENQSFKETAVKLSISPQAVTRAIKELENLQGELLFHRNTRHMQLTHFGHRLFDKAKPLIREFDALFAHNAKEANEGLAGKVRIAAPLGFGRSVVTPIVVQLLKKYPDINIELMLSDKRADVVEERIDIGLRIGFIRDNRFIVKTLGQIEFFVVAAPELIQQQGRPQTPGDLQHLPTSSVSDPGTGRTWPWYFNLASEQYSFNSRIVFDDAEAEFKAALDGLVFAQVPGFLANKEIRSGKLMRVLNEFDPEPWTLFIYRPQRGPVPKRVRLIYDELVTEITASLN